MSQNKLSESVSRCSPRKFQRKWSPHWCLHLPDTRGHPSVTLDLLPQALKRNHLSVGRWLDVPMIVFFFFPIFRVAFSFSVRKTESLLVEGVWAWHQRLHKSVSCRRRAGRGSQRAGWASSKPRVVLASENNHQVKHGKPKKICGGSASMANAKSLVFVSKRHGNWIFTWKKINSDDYLTMCEKLIWNRSET